MKLRSELASRNRFGMKPGLAGISAACAALGHPEQSLRGVIHIAGTNGKGAVCAMLDSCLRAAGCTAGRYTSPHLVSLGERFFLNGASVAESVLDDISQSLSAASSSASFVPLTYFEYLTLVAFVLYARVDPDFTILETGLGGRLDATNVCTPTLTVITRVGLDHCDVLGGTVEAIAAEKAGIVKPGVPIVLGRNSESVRRVVAARAAEVGAPFYYAPELMDEASIPRDFALAGTFNRENALTAMAALKVLGRGDVRGLAAVAWPGRFQRVGCCIVDGAHNPPAALALATALRDAGVAEHSLILICGFCGDKDVNEVLRILSPFVRRAIAVRTGNPRSLAPEELAARLAALGISATCAPTVREALAGLAGQTLIAGSLFLAGEALVALGALPPCQAIDPSERL